MKVLLINGSPHQDGATYKALNTCADRLKAQGIQTEILWLGVLPMPGCIACGACRATGECYVGDLVNEVGDRLRSIDGLIIGSPVYYAAPAGQLTAFLDRLFYSSSKKMDMMPAAAVVTCRRGGATAAFEQLNQYFLMNNIPQVPSSYWNQVHSRAGDIQE